jgi:hypothetical protein
MANSALQTPEKAFLNLDFLNSPSQEKVDFCNDVYGDVKPMDDFFNDRSHMGSTYLQCAKFQMEESSNWERNNSETNKFRKNNLENYDFHQYNDPQNVGFNPHNFDKIAQFNKDFSPEELFNPEHVEDAEKMQILGNSKCTSMKKFTCRFDIQIPNEPKFRVARKIIGYKGGNMKQIIDMCKLRDHKNRYGVKLRLRGRGSGFKEGSDNKESDDDLHLCVSSQFLEYGSMDMITVFPFYKENIIAAFEVFKLACESVEALLLKIYKEYGMYMMDKHQVQVKLSIKKSENSPALMMYQMHGY